MTDKPSCPGLAAFLLALTLSLGTAGPAASAGHDRPGYGPLRFQMTRSQVARLYPKMKRIEAGHFDLNSPRKWLGRTWRTVAVFQNDRLVAVTILTAYDPAHFRQVATTAQRDLGRPGVYQKNQKKLLYWRQSRRVIVLGASRVGTRPVTFMRFMPRQKTTATPSPSRKTPSPPDRPGTPGRKPASGVWRATGEYQVCSGRVPYRFCSSRFAWGTGRTEIEAQVSCNNHMARMVQILTMGGSTAYIVRRCRVIK
jgi:hypothetical protein